MFPLTPSHIPGKIFKGGGDEYLRFLIGPNLSVVRAPGRTETDAEGLAPERSVRGRHENLRGDIFLSLEVRPGELA
jgi:hypothetical protein